MCRDCSPSGRVGGVGPSTERADWRFTSADVLPTGIAGWWAAAPCVRSPCDEQDRDGQDRDNQHADGDIVTDTLDTADLTSTLDALRFDDRFVRELPGDPIEENRVRQVERACYSLVTPTPVAAPRTLAVSQEMADELGISTQAYQSEAFAQVFAGNRTLPDMRPYAACYGGHQFGHWAGQLGDGRAITLGECITPANARAELQLKGAGPTPYSRRADGRAVLRSSVREFLCSEAMHHLRVPTTRALSLVATGDEVVRDMFYDGNSRPEPGAIVCRVAPSFLRFGSYQIHQARGDFETLRTLGAWTLRHLFPDLGEPSPDAYLALLREVGTRTAALVCDWMRVGFVHGVLNTDNMSILGLTIDYGPYGWIDDFDPMWTPNTTDAQGRRYRFGQQPQVIMWNLVQLANALYPLIEDVGRIEGVLIEIRDALEVSLLRTRAEKIGLETTLGKDVELLDDLDKLLSAVETDMTLFYRGLARVSTQLATVDTVPYDTLIAPLREAFYAPDDVPAQHHQALHAWLERWAQRCAQEGAAGETLERRMNQVNPYVVLRNYIAQEVIDAATAGDTKPLDEVLDAMRRPYEATPSNARYATKRPDWARHKAGCSMLSCSS